MVRGRTGGGDLLRVVVLMRLRGGVRIRVWRALLVLGWVGGCEHEAGGGCLEAILGFGAGNASFASASIGRFRLVSCGGRWVTVWTGLAGGLGPAVFGTRGFRIDGINDDGVLMLGDDAEASAGGRVAVHEHGCGGRGVFVGVGFGLGLGLGGRGCGGLEEGLHAADALVDGVEVRPELQVAAFETGECLGDVGHGGGRRVGCLGTGGNGVGAIRETGGISQGCGARAL